MTVFVIIITLQVVGRNFLKIPMVWSNDLSVVFFVWAVFFGSAIAVRYRRHYVLEFLPEKFRKANCFLDIIGDISGLIFFYIFIRYGYNYTVMGLIRLSPAFSRGTKSGSPSFRARNAAGTAPRTRRRRPSSASSPI